MRRSPRATSPLPDGRPVRRPAGIIAAVVGTVLATSLFDLIAVALLGGWFAFSATREERYLAGELPESYPAYKPSTKMLISFVF